MTSVQNILYCARKVASIDLPRFVFTLLLGLAWRFTLICGYVFSIQAIGMEFNARSEVELNSVEGLGFFSSSYSIVLLILALFLLSAYLDVVFSRNKLILEKRIEVYLIYELKKNKLKRFKELVYSRRTYASQVLIKTFDIIYSLFLIIISVVFISLISLELVFLLSLIAVLFGGVMLRQKRSYKKQVNTFRSKGAPRRVRAQKVIRSANVRATTTSMAGIFLALLVLIVSNGFLDSLELMELAIVAFCTRFFVAFFSILYINFNALSDSSLLVLEFNSI